jgi:Flp pilus assembly CpaE family ATPase
MRTIIAADSPQLRERLLQAAQAAGLVADPAHSVSIADLAAAWGQSNADLYLVALGDTPGPSLEQLAPAMLAHPRPLIVAVDPVHERWGEAALQTGALDILRGMDWSSELPKLIARLRPLQARPTSHNTIAILAPTTGSGGTSLAVHLAAMLAQSAPQQVALAELTADGGDAGVLLDLEPRYTLSDFISRLDRIDEAGLARALTVHSSGLRLLANPSTDFRNPPLDPACVRRLVHLLQETHRDVILKLDRRPSPAQVAALELADRALLVLRPDVPSVKRARQILDQLRSELQVTPKWILVVNRAGMPGELSPDAIERSLGKGIAHFIPDSPRAFHRAANAGTPLYGGSRFNKLDRHLARLAQELRGEAAPVAGLGFEIAAPTPALKPVVAPPAERPTAAKTMNPIAEPLAETALSKPIPAPVDPFPSVPAPAAVAPGLSAGRELPRFV